MKVLLFANSDWYLYNFRRALAEEVARAGMEVVLVSPPGNHCARFGEIGLRWIPLAMDRRSLNPWRELGVIFELTRIYRSERPDLVHHFTLKAICYGSIAAHFAGVPARVNAITGLGYVYSSSHLLARSLRPLLSGVLRFALSGRRTRAIFQNADDQARLTRSNLVALDRSRLIRGSGVDTSRFRPSPARNAGPVRVLMATRLLWSKGVGEYVQAAHRLRDAGFALQFVLAGAPDTANPDSVTESCIEAWRAEGVVQVLGHVEDMHTLLQTVDIVALPTSYAEGIPRVLLEAAAAGLAIIASNTSGCREIVEDGKTGILIPSGDTQALTSAIVRLAMNSAMRVALGREARMKVERQFEEKDIIAQTLKVYQEVLDERPGFGRHHELASSADQLSPAPSQSAGAGRGRE